MVSLEEGAKYRLKLRMGYEFDVVYKGVEEYFDRTYRRFVLPEGFAFVFATDADIETTTLIT